MQFNMNLYNNMAIGGGGGFQIGVILNLGEYLKSLYDGINISIFSK